MQFIPQMYPHSRPVKERYRYYMKNLSSSHDRLCPQEIFEEDPDLGLRDIILKVIQKLKQNRKVVIDDDNGEKSKRTSFIKLIKKKVTGKTIGLLAFLPKYGLDQIVWSREYYRVDFRLSDGTYVSQSDSSISNWFDAQDATKVSYHMYNEPSEAEGFSVMQVCQPLCALSNYQFEVPALFMEWDGILMGRASPKKLHPAVCEICKKWLSANTSGRVILVRWGYSNGGSGDENERENMGDIVREIVTKVSDTCVYLFHVQDPSEAGKFSRPPETAILAYLQKQHCLDLQCQKTRYLYQHPDHMKMAEKVGVRCIKISRLLQNPSLVLSCHSTTVPHIPDFLRHLKLKPSLQAPSPATVPLYQHRDSFNDCCISVDLGHGYREYLFVKDLDVLEKFQENYRQNASCLGENSTMNASRQSESTTPSRNVTCTSKAISRESSREIPKWMLNKSNTSASSKSSGSLDEESSNTSVKVRQTEYVMTENELREVAEEVLQQAGRGDIIKRIEQENLGSGPSCYQDDKHTKALTEEESSDLDFDIPPIGSDSDCFLPTRVSEECNVENKKEESLVKCSALDDLTTTAVVRKASPQKRKHGRDETYKTPASVSRTADNSSDTGTEKDETNTVSVGPVRKKEKPSATERCVKPKVQVNIETEAPRTITSKSTGRRKPDLSALDELFF